MPVCLRLAVPAIGPSCRAAVRLYPAGPSFRAGVAVPCALPATKAQYPPPSPSPESEGPAQSAPSPFFISEGAPLGPERVARAGRGRPRLPPTPRQPAALAEPWRSPALPPGSPDPLPGREVRPFLFGVAAGKALPRAVRLAEPGVAPTGSRTQPRSSGAA